jgi:hypothetical protein
MYRRLILYEGAVNDCNAVRIYLCHHTPTSETCGFSPWFASYQGLNGTSLDALLQVEGTASPRGIFEPTLRFHDGKISMIMSPPDYTIRSPDLSLYQQTISGTRAGGVGQSTSTSKGFIPTCSLTTMERYNLTKSFSSMNLGHGVFRTLDYRIDIHTRDSEWIPLSWPKSLPTWHAGADGGCIYLQKAKCLQYDNCRWQVKILILHQLTAQQLEWRMDIVKCTTGRTLSMGHGRQTQITQSYTTVSLFFTKKVLQPYTGHNLSNPILATGYMDLVDTLTRDYYWLRDLKIPPTALMSLSLDVILL